MRDYTDENMRYGNDDYAADADGHASFDEHHDCLIHRCDHFRCKLCLICPQCELEKMEDAADAA